MLGLEEQPVERGVGRKLKVIVGRLRPAFRFAVNVPFGVERRNRESNSVGLGLNCIPGRLVADQIRCGLYRHSETGVVPRRRDRIEQWSAGRRALTQDWTDYLKTDARADISLAGEQQTERRLGVEWNRFGNLIGELQAAPGREAALRFQLSRPVREPSRRLFQQRLPLDRDHGAALAHTHRDRPRGGRAVCGVHADIGPELSLGQVGRSDAGRQQNWSSTLPGQAVSLGPMDGAP